MTETRTREVMNCEIGKKGPGESYLQGFKGGSAAIRRGFALIGPPGPLLRVGLLFDCGFLGNHFVEGRILGGRGGAQERRHPCLAFVFWP